uniref:t-SNARE coiled-coil homology domain-containing protein n=1 Tax=Dulem virus 33 TaxID=3145751 RepID=A0AAU8B9I3_9CAUD
MINNVIDAEYEIVERNQEATRYLYRNARRRDHRKTAMVQRLFVIALALLAVAVMLALWVS